jgi:uncharacterized YigZ family protein
MRVVNSRFIATAGPALTVEAAKAFIERIKEEFADATHNVPAYVVGHGATVIAHCSDDGEPSGTAGPPALAVLRGSGLGDAVVVVTRYFGGTKLGTGGLVRAYSDAVRQVLSILPRAQKVATHTVRFTGAYSHFERIQLLVPEYQGQILEQDFAAEITLTVRLPQEQLDGLQAALLQLSGGQIEARILTSSEATIMPLDELH